MAIGWSVRALSPRQRIGLRLAGAGLLAATAAIHLDLYLTGFRSIPTIGALFLLQVIAAFGLGAAVAVSGSRLVAAAGAGFALSTLGGYLLTVWIGLFGFKEVRTTAGIVAGVIEVAAFSALAAFAAVPAAPGASGAAAGSAARGQQAGQAAAAPRGPLFGRLRDGVPGAIPAVGVVAVVAVAVLAISLAGAGGPPAAVTGSLRTASIGGVQVLTNAKGFTLYWFAPDTPTTSNCNGSCAAYWPPVIGTPSAGPGVPGKLGTIRRSDGSAQATYDGHPLYSYIADAAPGQAKGNGINLNGGVWHEVAVAG